MTLFDILCMGFRNLWRRKMRTFLTVLGVVIGTASIMVMLSLGIGMDESFKQQLKKMGNLNIITVHPSYGGGREGSYEIGMAGGPNEQPSLDDKAVATLSQIEGVEAVMPIMETYLKLVSNRYTANVGVVGTDVEKLVEFDFKTTQGRLLRSDDINAIVVGGYVPRMFRNPRVRMNYRYGMQNDKPLVDVMKDRLELTFDMSYGQRRRAVFGGGSQENQKPPKLYKVNCVGILEESQGDDRNHKVYMDIAMLRKLIKDNNKNQRNSNKGTSYAGVNPVGQQQDYQQIKVKVKDINKVDEVQEKIKKMGYNAYSLADVRKSMQEYSQTTQMILGGIGAISLLVASLGITNTMVMSIYERTREIGIMKVLGCRLGDLRRMFLVEAAIIGLLGGGLGTLFSYGVSYGLNHFSGRLAGASMFIPMRGQSQISIIPPWLVLSALVFATCIGLVSGLYPAYRAMKLSALEAIRNE